MKPSEAAFYNLKHPLSSSTWDEREKQAILEVVESGNFTMGWRVKQFEKEFAEYIGCKYAVMVNSGSSANLLMVAAFTLRHGPGTVIAPILGWSTSYSPFQQYGWKIHFVGIDDSLCIDPAQAALCGAVGNLKAVLAVNVLGNSCDYDMLPGKHRTVPVLEDNCESLGAEYNRRKTGTFGVMASHSFFFSHHMCTMEGGMITTNDETYKDMLLCLRSHGWTRHLETGNRLNQRPGNFTFCLPGYNVRPTEIQGALGSVQLQKLDQNIKVRRDNAARFPLKTQREVGKSSWYGFAVEDTETVQARCETRPVIAGNFLKQPAIKYYDFTMGPLNGIEKIDSQVMIGNHAHHVDWGFLA